MFIADAAVAVAANAAVRAVAMQQAKLANYQQSRQISVICSPLRRHLHNFLLWPKPLSTCDSIPLT